jgi:hypothetical protein
MFRALHPTNRSVAPRLAVLVAVTVLFAGAGAARAQNRADERSANDGPALERYCPVYVIENAHKLYPHVYEDRFEGLPLEVTGHVIKRDGKTAWIQPTNLKVIN